MPESGLSLQLIAVGVILIMVIVAVVFNRRRGDSGGVRAMPALDKRAQLAAEAIQGDSTLTDELTDAPANRLLDWALAITKQMVTETSDLGDDEAQPLLDERLQNLRRVMRRINSLIGAMSGGGLSAEETAEKLQKVFDAASELPAIPAQPPESLPSAAQSLSSLPPEDALNKVLSYLTNRGR